MASANGTYDNNTVVDKNYTDKMGQRKDAKIPSWMEKNAPIPDHVKDLVCEKIELPFAYCKHEGRWIVIVRNVLTKAECEELIKFSEEQGYEDALVNIGYGRQKKMNEFRNCKRMMIDDYNMADCIWKRLTKFIPTYFKGRKKIAFNERLRFLRYHKNEYFKPHFDGTYMRPNGERSQITLLLYLNEGFVGARTNLLDTHSANYHAPKISTGMVLMFQHDIYHEGAELLKGTKYIVRTDVMYSKKTYKDKKIKKDKNNIDIQYVKYDKWVLKNKDDDDMHQLNDDNDDQKDKNVDDIVLDNDNNDNNGSNDNNDNNNGSNDIIADPNDNTADNNNDNDNSNNVAVTVDDNK